MAELKTKPTTQDPKEFLETIEPEQKRSDSFALLDLIQKITKEKPVMWGTSIIGYGLYHYKSERSSQEGDWPLTGFSPRKQNITLYIMSGIDKNKSSGLLAKLGKYKASGGCLYINKIEDINMNILSNLIKESFEYNKKKLTGK